MLPRTREEQLQRMAESGNFNRNWLEYEAVKWGVDFDHIRGVDEDLYAKEPLKVIE